MDKYFDPTIGSRRVTLNSDSAGIAHNLRAESTGAAVNELFIFYKGNHVRSDPSYTKAAYLFDC